MIHDGSSQQGESNEMTPAKRTRPPVINLEDAFDQNFQPTSACTNRVKKEKNEKSG